MDISSRDESDSANMARLTAKVQELEARLGPDPLAGDEFQTIRPAPVDTAKLEALLAKRAGFLNSLDAVLDQLADAYGYLVRVNGEIAAFGLPKQFRGDLGGMAERALILAHLGTMKIVDDRRLDKAVAPSRLASLSAIHDKILAVVEGLYAEPETPVVALTRTSPALLEAPK